MALALLTVARCAPAGRSPVVAATGGCERGIASYYADKFAGRQTANGERYDAHAMTAAHRQHRFGARLRVEYKDRAVVVRVNDRGPYARGAIIDLSRAAAEQLGIISLGRAEVRVCSE